MALVSNSGFVILYRDLVPNNVLTVSSEDASFPHANLEDTNRQTYWKASGSGAQWVKLYKSSAMSVCGFAILNHNFQTAGVTSITWDHSTDGSSWTTGTSIPIANIGNNDFFWYETGSDKYWRLSINGATSAPTLGRLFVPDNAWPLNSSASRPPIEGTQGGDIMPLEVIQTLAGIEHVTYRALPRRRRVWALNHMGSTDQAFRADLVAACFLGGKTFVISDPENSTAGATTGYGQAIHVRNNTEQFMRTYQVPALEAYVLDMLEVL
jgi:hypothetical protein